MKIIPDHPYHQAAFNHACHILHQHNLIDKLTAINAAEIRFDLINEDEEGSIETFYLAWSKFDGLQCHRDWAGPSPPRSASITDRLNTLRDQAINPSDRRQRNSETREWETIPSPRLSFRHLTLIIAALSYTPNQTKP